MSTLLDTKIIVVKRVLRINIWNILQRNTSIRVLCKFRTVPFYLLFTTTSGGSRTRLRLSSVGYWTRSRVRYSGALGGEPLDTPSRLCITRDTSRYSPDLVPFVYRCVTLVPSQRGSRTRSRHLSRPRSHDQTPPLVSTSHDHQPTVEPVCDSVQNLLFTHLYKQTFL